MENILGRYTNGNTKVTTMRDGTRITEIDDDEFRRAFAEIIDIKICDRCDMLCKMCHEGSTPDGKLGDIMNEKFVDTLHPYQEVNLEGGNILEHPDFTPFLHKLKNSKVITNIMLNQVHFEKNFGIVENMVNEELVYGLGVSLVHPTEEFIMKISKFPNAFIRVINGIVQPSDIEMIENRGLKMAILGYKYLRRGNEWFEADKENIVDKQAWLYYELPTLVGKFEGLFFDDLADKQLDIKERLSQEKWGKCFDGDEGVYSYYIDMVERKFARNSAAPFNERYDLLDSVDDMFRVIQKK